MANIANGSPTSTGASSDVVKPGLSITAAMGRRIVFGIQLLFILIALPGIDSPFLTVHFERQNQTVDIARHVFREHWRAILFPKASFSLNDRPTQPFTSVRLEVPFYGIFAWPVAALTGHERAAFRMVAILFGLLSIELLFRILRHWLNPLPALAGTLIWATAPLVLHFGQVPMPDILCTTGVLASFYFALCGKLWRSSVCFLFAILAKVSVLGFGLPILVALLVRLGPLAPWPTPKCSATRPTPVFQQSLRWGIIPLCGLLIWLWLDTVNPTPGWTILGSGIIAHHSSTPPFLSPIFCLRFLGCLLPFGLGIVGGIGLLAAARADQPGMNRVLRWSIIVACAFYFLFVLRKIIEPQYFLPLLAFLVIFAAFGLNRLLRSDRLMSWPSKLGLAIGCLAHVLVVVFATNDLKTSRIPNFAEIEEAARRIPPNSRVVAIYRHYGAGPAVWLNCNVTALWGTEPDLEARIQDRQRDGFTHLLVLDIESRYTGRGFNVKGLASGFIRAITGQDSRESGRLTTLVDESSRVRRFCDHRYQKLMERPHLVLYSLQGDATTAVK